MNTILTRSVIVDYDCLWLGLRRDAAIAISTPKILGCLLFLLVKFVLAFTTWRLNCRSNAVYNGFPM